MRLSRLSNLPLLGLDFFALSNLSPLRRIDAMRFDHIRRPPDEVELLLRVWRQFIALSVDFNCPMFNLSKDMYFILGVDETGYTL